MRSSAASLLIRLKDTSVVGTCGLVAFRRTGPNEAACVAYDSEVSWRAHLSGNEISQKKRQIGNRLVSGRVAMGKAKIKAGGEWKRWQLILALSVLGVLVTVSVFFLAPSTYTLQDALAKQFGQNPKFIQVNVPPLPGLYPGAVIVHPEVGKIALLISSTATTDAPGPEFSIQGASLSASGLTLGARADALSQMLSDSDRFSFTIELTHARVHERTLLDLKKAVLADENILSAYRKGARPEVVHRAYEAVPTITVRRRTKVTADEWAKIKGKAALESQAQVNSDDSTSFVAKTPVVLAFQTVQVDYLSKELGSAGKPDDVRFTNVERAPNERFGAGKSRPRSGAPGFACFHCGHYTTGEFFNLAGAECSALLVGEELAHIGCTPLVGIQTTDTLTVKDFDQRLEEFERGATECRPDMIVFYWMGHMVSLRTGSLYLVMSDAPPDLPRQDDYALMRHQMAHPNHPAAGSNLGEIFDVLQQVEGDNPANEPGLVSVASVHHRLSKLGIPFALLIDGCFDRKDLAELRKALSFDERGDYYGPNLGSGEEQLTYQHAMDAFGNSPYLRAQNVVILAAKPGSRANVVSHPFHCWDISPEVGPLAARFSRCLSDLDIHARNSDWGTILAQLADWRGTGEVDFRGTVSWSDFGQLKKITLK